jgi:hypothetical protein
VFQIQSLWKQTIQDIEWSVPVCSYVQFDLDLLTSEVLGVIDSLGCTSVSSLMSIKQRVLKILSSQYIPMSSLTTDLLTLKSKGVIYSLDVLDYQVRCLRSNGSSKYWVVSVFLLPVWPLTFRPQNQQGSFTLYAVPVFKVWSLSSKRLLRYWVVRIFKCPVWHLNFWPQNQ